MKTHLHIVAALHIAMGAFTLLGALIFFAMMGMAGSIVIYQGEHEAAGIMGIVAIALGGFLTLLSLPSLVGGWALYTGRSWGRLLVLVLGALHLLNVPFGTALGIYTFWALLREEPHTTSTPTLQPAA